jgi:hypothetical protein
MSAGYLRSAARVAVVLAVTILPACASNTPPPPSGSGDSPDSTEVDYDRMFLEIHSDLTAELLELERSGSGGAELAEVQSIVMAAEEFYLEGKTLLAIKLLSEAELLLRQ